jgi:DNA-binding NtrC family response regulator
MIVDDEKDILTVITRGLQAEGYNVHAFDRPETALQHVRSGCNDCTVVVSDIRMAPMSGTELVKEIKKIRPETKAMLMTAFEVYMDEFAKVLPAVQVDGLILKPFKIPDLIEAINKFGSEQTQMMEGEADSGAKARIP